MAEELARELIDATMYTVVCTPKPRDTFCVQCDKKTSGELKEIGHAADCSTGTLLAKFAATKGTKP
jgi:hypothetical protein